MVNREMLEQFIQDNFFADFGLFNRDTTRKKAFDYFDEQFAGLLQKTHPLAVHEERGKLCGYAFEKGDLVYRCK